MSEWNKIKGKDEDSIILGEEPETETEEKKEEIKFKNKIPAHCTGCFWIKPTEDDKEIAECRYEGDHYDDFDVDTITLNDDTIVGDCHSKANDVTEEDVKDILE